MSAMKAKPVREQLNMLQLIDRAIESAELSADLIDRRRLPVGGGSERLLRTLVVRGLDPDALKPAAALVLAIEQQARQHRPGRSPCQTLTPRPPSNSAPPPAPCATSAKSCGPTVTTTPPPREASAILRDAAHQLTPDPPTPARSNVMETASKLAARAKQTDEESDE